MTIKPFKDISMNIAFTMYAGYLAVMVLASLGLGVFLIYSHGGALLDWIGDRADHSFPFIEALHVVAGLLLFKTAGFMRSIPSIAASKVAYAYYNQQEADCATKN